MLWYVSENHGATSPDHQRHFLILFNSLHQEIAELQNQNITPFPRLFANDLVQTLDCLTTVFATSGDTYLEQFVGESRIAVDGIVVKMRAGRMEDSAATRAKGEKQDQLPEELVKRMEHEYDTLLLEDKIAADARVRYLTSVTAGTSWNELSEQEREVHTATANRLGAKAKEQYLENLKVNPALRIIDEIIRLKQKVPAENTKEHEGFAEILAKANSQILFWKGEEGNNFKYVSSDWNKDLTLGISDYSSFRLTTGNLEELLTRLEFLPDVSFDQLGNHTYHRLTDDELQQNERYPSIKRAPVEGAKNAYTYLLQSTLLPGVTARVNRDVWNGKSSHMIFFEFSHEAIKQTLHHLPPQLRDDVN